MILVAIALMGAGSGDFQVGPWEITERCATGFDNFGCARAMSQTSQALDVTLIVRDDLELRGTIRSCDEEPVFLSTRFQPKGRASWTKHKAKVLSFVEAWKRTAQAGCAEGLNPSISLSDFSAAWEKLRELASKE